jgi:hypothetical protein
MAQKRKIPEKYRLWIEARRQFSLSHAHIQMARELGMNPKKLGKLANQRQEPWKVPLPTFIERCYLKRFGKRQPDQVKSIEEIVDDRQKKKAERQIRKGQEKKA